MAPGLSQRVVALEPEERDFEMNMNRLRSFRVATSLLAFCLLAWFSPATAEAGGTTHNVRVNGDIQAAINAASNGDTIQLAAGQYDITTTIDPGGKQVTILGTVDGNGDPTSILDGGNPVGGTSGVRVLICQNGETSTTIFQNLVIQNGFANNGGGMYNYASSPTLTNCTFTSNSANFGGGMYNRSSSPALTNCTFTGNSAGQNGGGMSNNQSSPTLTNCTFASNSANSSGGGMSNFNNSSPTLTNCNFCGNLDGSGFNSFSGDAINGSSSGNNLVDALCVFGDINFDGVANLADRTPFNTLIGVCDADINGDGEVNGADMAFILSWWGVCSP
jgi:hypothetical protein